MMHPSIKRRHVTPRSEEAERWNHDEARQHRAPTMETWNDEGKSTRRTRPMAEVASERRRNAETWKHEDA